MNDCTACERMTRAETKIEDLEEGADRMDKKIESFQKWFMGLMGTSILSLLLLVANLLERKG